jgi:heme-degrading monooxygenase HmoA
VIVRVLSAKVRAGRVSQFNAGMRRQVAMIREQPGLVHVKLGRRLEADGGEEVVLFEEWQDPDSVYAWAGSDLSKPRLMPDLENVADSVTVGHFEALEPDADQSGVSPLGPTPHDALSG